MALRIQFWLGLVACCAAMEISSHALSLGSEFSFSSNPSGNLSLGYITTEGGTLSLFTSPNSNAGMGFWRDGSLAYLSVGFNPTSETVTLAGPPDVVVPAQSWLMHPGGSGEFAVVRYTVPAAGTFQVTGWFSGADQGGTTSDVHVLKNGVALFNGNVNGYGAGSQVSFGTTVSLASGDVLDFTVGYGSNANFSYDSTAFAASVTAVPEPAGVGVVVGFSLIGLAMWHRARQPAVRHAVA